MQSLTLREAGRSLGYRKSERLDKEAEPYGAKTRALLDTSA